MNRITRCELHRPSKSTEEDQTKMRNKSEFPERESPRTDV